MTERGRLVVAGLALALVAGAASPLAGLVASALRRPARALEDWYDLQDRLGDPCPAEPRSRRRIDTIEIELPACWNEEVVRTPEGTIHFFKDPGLGWGDLAVKAVSAEREREWRRAIEDAAFRRRQPGARAGSRAGFESVYTLHSEGRPDRPFEYHDWYLVGPRAAVNLTFRVPKVFTRSPKVARSLVSVAEVVASVREARAPEPPRAGTGGR